MMTLVKLIMMMMMVYGVGLVNWRWKEEDFWCGGLRISRV